MTDNIRILNRMIRIAAAITMAVVIVVSAVPVLAIEVPETEPDTASEITLEESTETSTTAAAEKSENELAEEETSEDEEVGGGVENSGITKESQTDEEEDPAGDDEESELVTQELTTELTTTQPVTEKAEIKVDNAPRNVKLRARAVRRSTGVKTITVTKTWLNDDENVRPTELTVNIKKRISVLLPGTDVEGIMKSLSGSGGVNLDNTTVTAIKQATDAQYEAIKDNLTSSNEVQASGEKTYMWFDNGTIYVYSEAGKVYINPNAGGMFRKFRNLTDISGLAMLDTSYCTDMNRLFQDTRNLEDYSPLSGWDTHYVRNLTFAFGSNAYNSDPMKMSDFEFLRNWDVSNVSSFNQTFKACWYVPSLEPIADWDVSRVTDFSQTFNWMMGLNNTTRRYIHDWDVRSVTNWSSMFKNAGTITEPVFSKRIGEWAPNGSTYSTLIPAVDPADPDIPPDPPAASPEYSNNGITSGSGSDVGDCIVTRNGNVWTYEFTVEDDDCEWDVWETTNGGYLDDKNGLANAYTESSNGTDGLGSSEENAIKGVTSSASITNTNTKRKEISVRKNWDDYSDAAGLRPDQLTAVDLHLKLNGTEVKDSNADTGRWTQSGDTWTYLFIDYSDEDVTNYSVFEDRVKYYASDGYDGKQVTRTGSPGGITETGELTITNTYREYGLDISKQVTGNQGDKTKLFAVTVSVSDAKPSYTYTITTTGGTPGGAASFTTDSSGVGSALISLKDTDSVSIDGLPDGSGYTVTETYGDYTPTTNVTGDSGATIGSGTVSGNISADTTVTFINNKSGILPTGLFLDTSAMVVMLSAAILGILITVLLIVRRRKRAEL